MNDKEQMKLYGVWTECLKIMSSGAMAEEVMPEILRLLAEYCACKCASIYEIDENETNLNLLCGWKDDMTGNIASPLKVRLADILENAQDGLIFCRDKNNSVNFMGCLLEADNRLIGLLGIEKPRVVSETFFLKHMSYLIAESLHKKRIMQKLETAGSRDALTRLNNRSKYDQTLLEIERKPPGSLGTIFLDINGLKRANDEQGHYFGDQLLMSVGRILKGIFKENAYRIGGDEFVVILPDVQKEEFDAMIIMLQEKIADENISVSIGCCYRSGNVDAKEQLKKADHLMYQNKSLHYEKM
ncbi:GGDEF domain-containing protein [Ruminococcus sp. OA3]|uniref:GGDEF domain-containing protein n=1 Tax=Ruminococcus sp. OA3 TaxID=2914164 RepID=UPI001F06289D|nr:GGDEF domain-containing protein [Ruminococcus sp. OA3]MCH1984397.1 GGDEF domain-containing protein [Ruminococcus sp. OA3]